MFISDHLQLAAMATVRVAWLLALGKLTVVAFFAIFVVFIARASIRKTGGCDEALAIALAIGSVISFASMWMASQVGETAALRLHATEVLMLLGTAVVLLVERPAQAGGRFDRGVARSIASAVPNPPIIADTSLTAWLAAGAPQGMARDQTNKVRRCTNSCPRSIYRPRRRHTLRRRVMPSSRRF